MSFWARVEWVGFWWGCLKGTLKGDIRIWTVSERISFFSDIIPEDPMRGLYFTVDLDLAVSAFSYGRAVVSFKSWGLQPVAAEEAQKPVEKAKALGLQESNSN